MRRNLVIDALQMAWFQRRAQGKTELLNGLNASVFEFMFDTTRMITNMVAPGAKKRFS